MKTIFKERLGLALMILSMMTPMVSHAEISAEAESAAIDQQGGQHAGGQSNGQQNGNSQAGAGHSGNSGTPAGGGAQAPGNGSAPTAGAPTQAPGNGGHASGGQQNGGATHNPGPTPPAHVGGPNPTERPPERHNDGNTGAAVVAGVELGTLVVGGIIGAIQRHNEQKVVSFNWFNGVDSDVHCYGINKAGRVANGSTVSESLCEANTPKPVNYQYERYQDGYDYCYKISLIDNSYLNNNYPVDNANCPVPAAQ